jgi:hypothetical protein
LTFVSGALFRWHSKRKPKPVAATPASV